MVWIPGGEFIMGTDDVRSFPNERPAHKVQVEGFWIDEHDVTNAEFAKTLRWTTSTRFHATDLNVVLWTKRLRPKPPRIRLAGDSK
jgi:formylglycine-generating enzyme required for sulfatase activity